VESWTASRKGAKGAKREEAVTTKTERQEVGLTCGCTQYFGQAAICCQEDSFVRECFDTVQNETRQPRAQFWPES